MRTSPDRRGLDQSDSALQHRVLQDKGGAEIDVALEGDCTVGAAQFPESVGAAIVGSAERDLGADPGNVGLQQRASHVHAIQSGDWPGYWRGIGRSLERQSPVCVFAVDR
ncbi:hypothetical protein D3C84_869030 [compost metagenome]